MTPEQLKAGRTILRSARIGLIVCLIAERLQITNIEALRLFYRSRTCRDFHDRSSGLYLQGDLYVVAEFMDEIQASTSSTCAAE